MKNINVKILVDEQHKEKIEAAISEAQGKASTRLATYADVQYAVKKLRSICFYKNALDGCTLRFISGCETIPHATYSPKGTYIDVECIHGKFYLVGVGRTWCNRSTSFDVHLTDTAKKKVLEDIEYGRI